MTKKTERQIVNAVSHGISTAFAALVISNITGYDYWNVLLGLLAVGGYVSSKATGIARLIAEDKKAS